MQCISFLLFFLYVLRQKAVTSCPFLLIDMMGQAELELHFLDNFLSRLFLPWLPEFLHCIFVTVLL